MSFERLIALASLLAIFAWGLVEARPASIAKDPTAAERTDRRHAARQGRLVLPLPGTPDTEKPLTRLAATGVSLGAPMMIRIFKLESELEVWVKKDESYIWFATYPVCFWSGKLGPKLREGDRQTPEGFYTITQDQLHYGGRWRRSLNIGFPNAFDRANGRTGSVILIHGGCDSVGCFAMTDPVKAELYDLVSAALRSGAPHVPVHVFPFRMGDEKLSFHVTGPWTEFWSDLKHGYDSFERTRLPPRITVCGKRYRIEDAVPGRGSYAQAVELCQDDLVPSVESAAGDVAERNGAILEQPEIGLRGLAASKSP